MSKKFTLDLQEVKTIDRLTKFEEITIKSAYASSIENGMPVDDSDFEGNTIKEFVKQKLSTNSIPYILSRKLPNDIEVNISIKKLLNNS